MKFKAVCNYVGTDVISKGDRNFNLFKVITPDGIFTFFADSRLKIPTLNYLESIVCEVLLINSANLLRARLLSVEKAKQ